jgi:alkylation response protein AidB-like acyl-CoA dehydrogenase
LIDFTMTEEEQLLSETARRFGDEHLRDSEREHEDSQAYPESVHRHFEELGMADLNRPDSGLEIHHRMAVWAALAEADPAAPFGLDPVGPGGAVLEGLPSGVGAICHQERIQIADGQATGTIAWVPRTQLDWLVLIGDEGLTLIHDPPSAPVEGRPCGLQACGGVTVQLNHTACETIGDAAQAQAVLDECRLLAATVMVAAARDAHHAAAKYSQERVAFGKPIAHHQGLAFQLADAATQIQAAQLLLEASAGCSTLIANAHHFADEVCHSVCERSVQVLGGHGYLYDHRVEKRMRDSRAVSALFGGSILSGHDAAAGILSLSDPLELS